MFASLRSVVRASRPIAGRGAKSLIGARRFHRSLIDSSRTSGTFAKKNAGPIKNAEAPKDAGALGSEDAALSLTGEASASTSPAMVSLSGEDLVLGMEKNGVFKEKKISKLWLRPVLWSSSITDNLPKLGYDSVMDRTKVTGMMELTNLIQTYGFVFVTDSPKTPEATEELLKAIGPIRNTHYGGFYDFVPDLAKADTAYTNQALAAHTDTTYFTDPVGLQAFHLLSHMPPPNKTGEEEALLGGQSLLVDGFHACAIMKREHPAEYKLLREVRIPWHASGNLDVAITPDRAYPVVEGPPHRVHRIRWNNDDRGCVPMHAPVDEWYDAARKWDEILRHPSNVFWFQLTPGRILIFDNWRILHGRSAFEGQRRICGGYINRDDFYSRWQLSNYPREDVVTANMLRR
ncbi:hypothetical protein E4U57_002726 [Claviceps arundinis]|uniref:TauD/TfdA-like domain-containing protein n=1 Tax=Claviceps arundinis TaxID=1623583 RepID=A0ABQ7P8J8_9HYPO|nr:hypothetical protein E4U57_002726 [Claviceps arundinis]